MATRRTHAYTSRADGGVTRQERDRRRKVLQQLKRPLTPEELAELTEILKDAQN